VQRQAHDHTIRSPPCNRRPIRRTTSSRVWPTFASPAARSWPALWRRTGRGLATEQENDGYQVCWAARTRTSLTATRRSRVTM
jgi:hypothetical protein